MSYRREDLRSHPRLDFPAYASTLRRAPKLAPIRIEQSISEITGPNPRKLAANPIVDLTISPHGVAIGERIVVGGRVIDEDERVVPDAVVEIWQANAAGRYAHDADRHDAPLDPNFVGIGRVVTNARGEYDFQTIKPGAYPWKNHPNAWRPNHIHFSVFGPAFATRLVTQMYFPGDPLLTIDPIFNSIADEAARARLVARFEIDHSIPEHALGYRFDIVLRGSNETPMEPQ